MDTKDTKLLTDSDADLRIAAEIIKDGGLVAFPTETVYGLGANALDGDAVRQIYEAKGRPSDNPTIAHIAKDEELLSLTMEVTKPMKTLMRRYWPGPMTMVVPRRDVVPHVTTGGLETVGVRMPSNLVARKLIELSGCPIAAPSANLSGKPSPTTAQHCIDDLMGRVDAIIQSDICEIGIESTVIDMTGELPMILRPGFITKEEFERVLGTPVLMDPTLNVKPEDTDFVPKAPGMKYKHYAPETPMILFQGAVEDVKVAIDLERVERESLGQKVVVLSFVDDVNNTGDVAKDAAHDIFAKLREADAKKADIILAEGLPEEGLGFSVMNRMLKSAGYNVRKV